MDQQLLERLLSRREHTKLDFKLVLDLETENGKKELAKDVIAMANTDGGRGYLIVGVSDDGVVMGVPWDAYSEERIQQIVGYRSDPPVALRCDRVRFRDVDLLVITIFKSLFRPHQYRQSGAFYLRRGSTTDFARRDEIGFMLKSSMLLSDDLYPLKGLGPDVLNPLLVKDYLRANGIKESDPRRLQTLGILVADPEDHGLHPTVGALLCLTEAPDAFVPAYKTRLIDRRGLGVTVQITGPIQNQYKWVVEEIKKRAGDFRLIQKQVELAVANALVHRDYLDNQRAVTIELYADRLVIKNPGALPGHTRLGQVLHRRLMVHRNPWIYRTLLFIGGDVFRESGDHLKAIQLVEKPFRCTLADDKGTQTFEVVFEKRREET